MQLKKLLHILFCGLLILFALPAYAQDYIANVEFYNYENGLAGRFANCTFQDNRGIIWIGTQYGLHRFDGRDFEIFDESTGLPFPQVMEIYEDQEGWLWLFRSCLRKPDCFKNLSFFHSVSHEVLTFEERFGNETTFQPEDIVSIMSDSSQIVYLTAKGQIIHWTSEAGFQYSDLSKLPETPKILGKISEDELLALYDSKHDSTEKVKYVKFDLNGNILIHEQLPGFFGNLYKSGEGHRTHLKNKASIANQDLSFYRYYKRNRIYFQYHIDEKGKIELFKKFGEEQSGFFTNEISPKYLFTNDNKILWSFELGMIKVYEKGRGLIYDFSSSHWLFKENRFEVRNIIFSEEGIVWLANHQGIYKIELKKNPFERLLFNPKRDIDRGKKYIARAIYPLGSERIFLFALGTSSVIQKDKTLIKFQNFSTDNETFYDIAQAPNKMFYGTKYSSLYKFNPTTFEIQHLDYQHKTPFSKIFKFHNDGQIFWVGTDKGLRSYDWQNNQMKDFEGYNGFEELGSSFIRFFHEENKDSTWLCTNSGLYLFSPEKGIINRFWDGGEKEIFLPAKDFYHIHIAKDGVFWLATKKGLIKWNRNASPKLFSSKNGFPTDWIVAVYEDDYGFLWLSTNKGLIQFQKSTELSKTWRMTDGLSQNEMEPNSHYQDTDGTLYFGTTNGFTKFHPKDFKHLNFEDRPNVPLIILDFEQFSGKSNQSDIQTAELLKNNEIVLHTEDRFFNIRLGLADYSDSKRTRFAYQIEGLQEGWTESGENEIQISRPPFGEYTLKIKGRLADGQFSANELHIPIQVLKPFYLQLWFILLSVLSLLALIYAYLQYRTNRFKKQQVLLEKMVKDRTETIEQQKEKLEHLDKVKSRFFANVSHELRTPLTLMLGPLSTMIKSNKLTNRNFTLAKLVQGNTKNLLSLVNEILDLTKIESDKMELKEEIVALYPFTQRLIAAFESHAQRQNLHFEIQFLFDKYLHIKLDKNKYKKILNNLLSNALKFTPPDGSISIQVEDFAEYIQLKVSDTGRGIHPDDLPNIFNRFYQSSQKDTPTEGGTGIGLALSMEFAKLMNGQLWAESTLGEGSSFFFKFPKTQVLGVNEEMEGNEENDPSLATVNAGIEETTSTLSDLATLAPAGFEPEGGGSLLGARAAGKATILIVEDNHALRDYIQLILSDKYEIITAENGVIAWEMLAHPAPPAPRGDGAGGGSPFRGLGGSVDIILSDIMMPQMDGYQLLQKLKSDDRFRHLPVIMLTARAEMEDKLKALRIGVDDYMLKPFEEEELFARVENLLRNSRERQEAIGSSQLTDSSPDSKEQVATISTEELQWLEELETTVKKELSNFNFNVELLAAKMAMSKRGLERKLKKLTGMSPSKYIQEIRFNQARQILENGTDLSIKALAFSIGVKDVVHFSRQFKARFGKLPSSFLE